MKRVILLLACAMLLGGWNVHGLSSWNGGQSQGQSSYLQLGNDDPFINAIKTAQITWAFVDVTCCARPDEVDANGYPLAGSDGFVNHQGYTLNYIAPNSNMRPSCGAGCTQRVFLAGGAGKVTITETGGGTQTTISCQYTTDGISFTNGTPTATSCDTTACSITTTCAMKWVRQVVNDTTPAFPTYHLSVNSVVTGNTLQNIADVHISDQAAFGWTMANWPGPNAVSHDIHAGNTGQVFGSYYLQRIAQGGFGVWRFVKWALSGGSAEDPSNLTTWATRKPISYVWYATEELRESLYVGAPISTNASSGNSFQVQYAVASVPGNYAWPGYTAGGTPVRNQTVIVNWSGTTTYNPPYGAVTAASGTPVVFTFTSPPSPFPANGTQIGFTGTLPTGLVPYVPYYIVAGNSGAGTFELALTVGGTAVAASDNGASLVATYGGVQFNLGGNVAPVFNFAGAPLNGNANLNYNPNNVDTLGSLIYDPDLNNGNGAWLSYSGSTFGGRFALQNGVPPELELALATQARVHPWFDESTLSMVPISDYMLSLAQYVKANAPPWMHPYFTAGNEPFGNQLYGNVKAYAYWGTSGDFLDFYGMSASLLCQAIYNIYGDKSKYECLVEPQTVLNGSGGAALVSAAEYVSNGPAQVGYAQDPAYKWLTGAAIYNYWSPLENNRPAEIADAWCYVNQGAGCTAAATIVSNYVATSNCLSGASCFSLGNAPATGDAYNIINNWTGNWKTWVTNCGAGSPPANCNMAKLLFYEGGYFISVWPGTDKTIAISSATNVIDAVLTLSGTTNGCFAGMTVKLTALTGGTWSTENGNSYTVQSTGATTCTINLDSTALGTLTGGTLTYVGSDANITAMAQASFLSSEVGTLTTAIYNGIIAADGLDPSMFFLSGALPASGNSWPVLNPSIYGQTGVVGDTGTSQWRCIQAFNVNNVAGVSCP